MTILAQHVNNQDIPEFSVAFMRNLSPLPLDRNLQRWIGCHWSHVAMLVCIDNKPYVFQSHPQWPKHSPFAKSGPQVHTLEDYESVVIPHWESQRWAKRGGGIYHTWKAPPFIADVNLQEKMRNKVIELIESDLEYGLISNYLFGKRGQMHCSQAVGCIQEIGGYGVSKLHRNTPCDCWNTYEEKNRRDI